MSTSTVRTDAFARFREECDRIRDRGEFDAALRRWKATDDDLADIDSYADVSAVLGANDYHANDTLLLALLRRAASDDTDANLATWMVVREFLGAAHRIAHRVMRARDAVMLADVDEDGRRGLRGGGVSNSDRLDYFADIVLSTLWERVRCYPLHRSSHVAANLTRDTQQMVMRSLGIYEAQTAANVVSIDDMRIAEPSAKPERDASEELLELLAWAVQERWLDEQSALILGTRYFGDDTGHHGIVTDDRIGQLLGMSQPTISRRRAEANRKLAAAAGAYPGSTSLMLAG